MFELPFDPPIEKIVTSVFKTQQVEVFLKREDMLHPFISGNKWRKLKYVFRDANTKGYTKLISFGGSYSNHLVALACAGAKYGFQTEAFVRGEQVNNPILSLCKMFGMQLHFVSREAYQHKNELVRSVSNEYYVIDEGGRGELAMQGCEEILDSVNGYSHVVCAVGTGTTMAGLIKGASRKNMKVEGICVLKGAEAMTDEIKSWVPALTNWTLHHQYHGGGYAKTSNELLRYMESFVSQTGILLDQVYTAKMMKGVEALTASGYFTKGDRILMIHTGGLLGMLSTL